MSSKTTAQILGRFRKELIEESVPAELADKLVLDAGHAIVENDGLGVKNA